MASQRKSHVFRVTGLSKERPDVDLKIALQEVLDDSFTDDERSQIKAEITIVPSCYEKDTQRVALVQFRGGVPQFLNELRVNPLGDWQVEMGDNDINFDCHFFGFTQLYTPDDSKPVVADIIAITGLDGHAYGSWQGRGNLGRMWLRDFLSKDLPQCRTMIYGYNSKLSSHGVDTILDYGRELMEEIKNIRNTKELRQRPLIFIAHSFGGIILAHCLVRAIQTMEEDHPAITSLHRATYGMLLFAIPHKGLVTDDIQRMLAGDKSHQREQLLQQISSKSDLLVHQLAEFKNLIRNRKVVSFYETKQTRQLVLDSKSGRWKRTGDFITTVSADSALLQLPDYMENKVPLSADHSMIVKFDTPYTAGYRTALNRLQQFVHDAPSEVAARFTQSLRLQSGSTMPFKQDPLFVGREAAITKVKDELIGQDHERVPLVEWAGVGKTQTAIDPADSWSTSNCRPSVNQLDVLDYYLATSNCGTGCICKCHCPLRLRLSLFYGVFGSIGIAMSRSSSSKSICTETTCSRRPMCVSWATVQPPAILLKRTLYLAVGIHSYGRFDISLRTLRIVPDNADIMQFAKKGNLDNVRSLFNKGLAAPTDVNDSWGVPVLSYAVQGLHLDLCRFLIREGAIPSVENRSNVSALDRAWDIFLSRSCDLETEQKLRSLFSLWYDSVWFEDQQFTSLHKIVLGAVDHDLDTQLKLSTSNINEKDSKGRTPIAWAAARGDVKSVQTLLSFGADPEIGCDTGNNPLLRSVRAKSPECVKILLEFGADVRRKSTLGFTALHYAAYYRDDDALLKTLLTFGAQIDEKDNYGWTPLSCTAEYDQYKSAQLLLRHGADPNISDNIGWTPITRAVSSNSHQVLKFLIEKGADYCSQTARLETILHFAAARGNIKTIELLTVATMRGLNVDMKDVDGRTASDVFYSREKRSSDLVTAFTNLLISVKNM